MCNHCDNPPCIAGVPHAGNLEERRRHCDDGLASLHRLPLLHCGLPLWFAQLQLCRIRGPQSPAVNPDFPTRTKGVVEKCNFCEERLARGLGPACAAACPEKALIFGNLADPDSEPRQLLRSRFAVEREPELGTGPSVYYLV